jgi:MFS family permease
MIGLLRQRNYGLLWFAGAVSMLGDYALMVALPFFIYDLTGSALATGGMFMAQTLPRILLGSVAGVFVDRWDRKRTLVIADLARGALMLLLLLVRSVDLLWLVYAVAIAQATIGQFFIPAKSALMPRLVGEDELVPANALNSLSDNLTRLVGPALGGALYGLVGLSTVVVIDATSFIISGALLALIAVPAGAAETRKDAARGVAAVWGEWIAGLRIVRQDRVLTGVFVMLGIAMINEGILVSLLVPFVKDVLGGSAAQLGWLMSAQAIGGVIGGLLIGKVGGRIHPLRLIALCGALDGLLLLIIINGGSLALALVLIAIAGVPVVGFFVSAQTLAQQRTEDKYRGRVFGAFGTVAALMTLLGILISGVLGDYLGIVATMSLGSVLYIVAGVVALVLRPAPVSTEAHLADGISSTATGD